MNMLAKTSIQPPYYAVIFTSVRTEGDGGYGEMAERMAKLVADQPGFLGMDSARAGIGITVCYWDSLESIQRWKEIEEHRVAQTLGQREWYKSYRVRICKVEMEYGWDFAAP
ncbi:antibiotic biosynthesis monooxygenase family protein [Alicyclobacillus sendaiensis]|uniref:antibiotic biosynthesis monooxygenase family protein n=1 Tax=Alicyclobacillus sendaiensis TaxID=192387 RepID=UPI0026F45C60|nr:antibiotic biosynthesis monooxygenase [Alicyclobacillus sendaiensis]